MPGIAYVITRTIRGLERTAVLHKGARFWDRKSTDLFTGHVEHAIAADGSPTGFELALHSAFRDVTVLRPTWRSFAGARRLRDFVLADPTTTSIALTAAAATSTGTWAVLAPDLDAIHEVALAAASPEAFCTRLRATVIPMRVHPARASLLRLATRFGSFHTSEKPVAAETSPIEDELVAAIVRAPADPAALSVYADWLEGQGRRDEAAAMRP